MPSRFEHSEAARLLVNDATLRLLLMPSGFEHGITRCAVHAISELRLPLMPSGFEHADYGKQTINRMG